MYIIVGCQYEIFLRFACARPNMAAISQDIVILIIMHYHIFYCYLPY